MKRSNAVAARGGAVDLLIAELEKRRLGKTTRPSKTPRKSTRRGYVPRVTRRQVFERDGERCPHVDEQGRRCEARTFLELDHIEPRALGRAHVEKKKAEKKNRPRQCGSENEVALRALCGMGFKETEARRVLGIVAEPASASPQWMSGRGRSSARSTSFGRIALHCTRFDAPHRRRDGLRGHRDDRRALGEDEAPRGGPARRGRRRRAHDRRVALG